MNIRMADLYHSMLGNSANLEKIKDDYIIKMRETEKKLQSGAFQQKSNKEFKPKSPEEYVADFRKKIDSQFKEFKEQSPQLRMILRELKAKHLEQALYGDDISPLPLDELKEHLPREDNIRAVFEKYDAYHHFFSDIKEDNERSKLSEKFSAFYKTLYLRGKLENTNQFDIEAQAYRMFVLFGGEEKVADCFKRLDDYLQKHHLIQNNRPVFESFLWPLPIDGVPKINLTTWRELIFENGPTFYRQFFQRAPQIEGVLGHAPDDSKEAVDAASSLGFARADEDHELANLCFEYGISETLFETCLSINPHRKKTDTLPDIWIDGKDVKHPRYHFVKMPVDDPHAYFTGYPTKCCLNIGSYADLCVRDAVTRENNGLYVLLKETSEMKSGPRKKALVNGKINYENFEIVGVGYCWRTQYGNLVFDSWENASPAFIPGEAKEQKDKIDLRDDKVAVAFLERFSHQVVEAKDSSIFQVLIGAGGKTPRYFEEKLQPGSERMHEGHPYGDAAKQSLILLNEGKQAEFVANLQSALHKILQDKKLSDEEYQQLINKGHIKGIQQAQELINLLHSDTMAGFLNNDVMRQKLLQAAKEGHHLWNVLAKMHAAKLDTPENFTMLLNIPLHKIPEFEQALYILSNARLLDQTLVDLIKENFHLLQEPGKVVHIANALVNLHQAGITDKNITEKMFSASGVEADSFSQAYARLQKEGLLKPLMEKKLLDDNICYRIYESLNSPSFANCKFAIEMLLMENLLDHKTLLTVSGNPSIALDFANALRILRDEKLDATYRDLIFENVRFAMPLTEGIVSLKQRHLLDDAKEAQANVNALIRSREYSKEIIEALTILQQNNALNEPNRGVIFENRAYAMSMAKSLVLLGKENVNSFGIRSISGDKILDRSTILVELKRENPALHRRELDNNLRAIEAFIESYHSSQSQQPDIARYSLEPPMITRTERYYEPEIPSVHVIEDKAEADPLTLPLTQAWLVLNKFNLLNPQNTDRIYKFVKSSSPEEVINVLGQLRTQLESVSEVKEADLQPTRQRLFERATPLLALPHISRLYSRPSGAGADAAPGDEPEPRPGGPIPDR